MNNKKTQVPRQRRQKFDACRLAIPNLLIFFIFPYYPKLSTMVIKGRTHEELWQIIIQNSLTELVKWGI